MPTPAPLRCPPGLRSQIPSLDPRVRIQSPYLVGQRFSSTRFTRRARARGRRLVLGEARRIIAYSLGFESMTRRIIAIGGGGFLMERGPSLLDEYFVRTADVRSPKVCFISTGGGDPEEWLAKYYKTFSKLGSRPSHLTFFRKPRRGSIPLTQIERGLLAQDAIYVGGGNTRSMLAVWREWGLDRILRKAWNAGVLLGGISAGALCWFKYGATDSVLGPGRSSALSCLGFLPGSCSPHFDGEPRRRGDFRRLIARG